MSEEIKVETPQTVLVQKKRKGGCGTFFMGFLMAFVFMIVVVGGLGAYTYFCVTLTQIERLFGFQLPIEGEIRDQPLKDLINTALQIKDEYVHVKIGEVETKFGINLPQTIPGTTIDLSQIYDSTITFKGQTLAVNQVELMTAANNFDEFVDAVLPVMYDHVTVGQLTESFGITVLQDLGYPVFTQEYFNVGTDQAPVLKKLNDLTITQVQTLVPEHFSQENLTIAELERALGMDLFPAPAAGEADRYAAIRNMQFTTITLDTLLQNLDGAVLAQNLDLSNFKFTLTDTFKNTKLSDMVGYLQTVPLSDFITVPNALDQNSSFQDIILYSISKITANDVMGADPLTAITNKIDQANPNLTLNDLIDFSTMDNVDFLKDVNLTDILRSATDAINNALQDVTVGKFIPLSSVVDADFTVLHPEFAGLENTKLSDIPSSVMALTLQQIFTQSELAASSVPAAEYALTIPQFLAAHAGQSLSNYFDATVLQNKGGFVSHLASATNVTLDTVFAGLTLSQILGEDRNISPLANIWDLNVSELIKDPSPLEQITSRFGTLSELCNSTTGIFAIIGDVKISDMLNDSSIIMTKLQNSTVTLAQMLEFTPTNPLISAISGIAVGDIFGANPEQAFITALGSNTLGTLLNFSGSTSPILQIIGNISAADLLGNNSENAILDALKGTAENPVTLGTLFELGNTGIASVFANVKMSDLLGADPSAAITNALSSSTIKLNTVLTTGDNTLMNIIGTLTVGDLFGANPGDSIYTALANATGTTLGELVGDTTSTGVAGVLMSLSVSDLFGANPGAAISAKIDTITLDDMFADHLATAPNNDLLKILASKGTAANPATLGNITTLVNQVTLRDMFGGTAPTSGIMSLLDENALDTKITEISGLQINIQNQTIASLIDKGLLDGMKGTAFDQSTENTAKRPELADCTLMSLLSFLASNDAFIQAYIDSLAGV